MDDFSLGIISTEYANSQVKRFCKNKKINFRSINAIKEAEEEVKKCTIGIMIHPNNPGVIHVKWDELN